MIDYGYFGTEDGDDDKDNEVAQNKLLILVANEVQTGTYAGIFLRGTAVTDYATSWLVSLLRRLRYRRSAPSIVALKTATLLASPLVEVVLRESPESTPHMVSLSLLCVK